MSGKPLVLFVCTHNAARSQMAEALLRKHAGHRFEVASAGTEPTEVHPLTRHVLTEAGIDPSGLSAKGTRDFLGKAAVRGEGPSSGPSRRVVADRRILGA